MANHGNYNISPSIAGVCAMQQLRVPQLKGSMRICREKRDYCYMQGEDLQH